MSKVNRRDNSRGFRGRHSQGTCAAKAIVSAERPTYLRPWNGGWIEVTKCGWSGCSEPIVAFDLERSPRCEEHAPCCPICGEADCDVMPCRECGASLCAGEPHDDLCCATGLSRLDREEMADDEDLENLDEELAELRAESEDR